MRLENRLVAPCVFPGGEGEKGEGEKGEGEKGGG